MEAYLQNSLIRGAGGLWEEATRAKFLDAIGDGALPEAAFRRWLEQDYHFAKGLTSFQAVAAAKTPRPAQSTLIAGLGAMDAELDWFERNARERGYDLQCPVHPTCRRYVDYLIASAYQEPFEHSLAILFGVEAAYLAAWSALKPRGPYAEFIERWSSPQFKEYVNQLSQWAEQHPREGQQRLFNRVLEFERVFWTMTLEG